MLKKICFWLLNRRAQKVLRRSKTVIGVTGSIGKTSTRLAIAQVLQAQFKVQTSTQNFNTPFGLIFSILAIEMGGHSTWSWLKVVISALFKKLPNPDVLVLEFGVDKPNDMSELVDIAKPRIVVLTPIAPVHLGDQQFGDLIEIRREKLRLITKATDTIIINTTDQETFNMVKERHPHVPCVTFGNKHVDARLRDIKQDNNGLHFTLGETQYNLPFWGENFIK